MEKKWWGRLMTIAVMAGAVAACDTTTGPDGVATFDANAALDDYRTMDAILASSSWKNFQVLGKKASVDRLGPVPAIALESAFELRDIHNASDARGFASEWTALIAGMDPVAANAPIISETHRGKTFIYDPEIDDYAVSERTGAPANGARFIVYETDSSGTPIVENEIGYFDLTDEGDNSVEDISLRLIVVEGSSTILDYATTLDENGPNGRITVDGFLTDGADRLDFQILATGSDAPSDKTLDVTFEMRVDGRNFSINGSVIGADDAAGNTGAVDLRVTHGSESLRVNVEGTESTISGTFYLNGDVFATMSGDPENPTFVGASGNGLTQSEALVLHEIVDVIEDVFDFFEDLMDPIEDLVVLAVIL